MKPALLLRRIVCLFVFGILIASCEAAMKSELSESEAMAKAQPINRTLEFQNLQAVR
jgi:hypothetical protein